MTARITGIDVSKWQRGIDWQAVAAAGHKFAFVKATEGIGYEDPECEAHVSGAYARGLDVGLYHFARADTRPGGRTLVADARAEADTFLDVWSRYDHMLALPPVLDIEWGGAKDVPAVDVERWSLVWLERVEEVCGFQPIVYCGRNFWRWKLGKSTEIQRYPLWLVSYSRKPKEIPGWPWLFWQHTNKLPCDGRKVDGNVFAGDAAAYETLLRRGEPARRDYHGPSSVPWGLPWILDRVAPLFRRK